MAAAAVAGAGAGGSADAAAAPAPALKDSVALEKQAAALRWLQAHASTCACAVCGMSAHATERCSPPPASPLLAWNFTQQVRCGACGRCAHRACAGVGFRCPACAQAGRRRGDRPPRVAGPAALTVTAAPAHPLPADALALPDDDADKYDGCSDISMASWATDGEEGEGGGGGGAGAAAGGAAAGGGEAAGSERAAGPAVTEAEAAAARRRMLEMLLAAEGAAGTARGGGAGAASPGPGPPAGGPPGRRPPP